MYRRIPLELEVGLDMPRPAVHLFRVSGRDRASGPMARHVRTPQLLAAVDGRRWGLWIAPPGAEPLAPAWIEVAPDEAILLEPGTWHRGPVPLEAADGAYLTVEAPDTNATDFEQKDVAAATG